MASENTRGRTWHSTGEVSVVGEMLPGTASFRVQNSQEQVAMLVEVTLYLQQISLPNWTQRSNFATRHLDSNTSWPALGRSCKVAQDKWPRKRNEAATEKSFTTLPTWINHTGLVFPSVWFAHALH